MVKIVATRFHILRLKCPKFDFGWGSTPDPAGGAQVHYSPDLDSWIVGVLGKGKEDRAGNGIEVKGERDRGRRKGKVGGKGEPAEGDRKDGRGMEGISLPHGHLKTLAALYIAYAESTHLEGTITVMHIVHT